MLNVDSVSLQYELFANFKRKTSLIRFLRWEGLKPLVKCGAYWVLAWMMIYFVALQWDGFPGSEFFQDTKSHKLLLGFLSELASAPIFFVLLGIYSKVLQKILLARGIEVTGFHWRGRDVDVHLLREYSDYLKERGFLNRKFLEKMAEALRDEISWRIRRQNIGFIVLSIVLAVVLGLSQPFIAVIAEDAAKRPIFGQLLLAVVQLCFTASVLVALFYYNWIWVRSARETYLQGLHAILLSLPLEQSIEGKAESHSETATVSIGAESMKSIGWARILIPIAALLIAQVVSKALTQDKDRN